MEERGLNRTRMEKNSFCGHKVSLKTDDSGFTLMEMLIVIMVSSILMGGLYSLYQNNLEFKRSQEIIVDMNQNVRSALSIMKNEIRFLGYDPLSASQGARSSAGIITPTVDNTGDTLTFTYAALDDGIDNDDNGVIDEVGELATITFALDGSSLTRSDTVTGPFTIADNVENVDFSVSSSGNNTTMVRVTLLMRANKVNKKITNEDPLIFVIPDGSGRTWTVTGGDSFRRQLVSTVINCRNT